MEVVDICNNALDLLGQGIHIDGLDEQSKEADLCRRMYQHTVNASLAKFYFDFARKDEVITVSNILNHVSLPWRYTLSIPSDVQTILRLEPIQEGVNEDVNLKTIPFNFRQVNGAKCLVTNEPPPFVMQYQAYVTDPNLFSDGFTEALEYILASKLTSALVHGATGVQLASELMQYGLQFLEAASGQDARQGGEDIYKSKSCDFIKARG